MDNGRFRLVQLSDHLMEELDDSWQHCLNLADSGGVLLFRLWKFAPIELVNDNHQKVAYP